MMRKKHVTQKTSIIALALISVLATMFGFSYVTSSSSHSPDEVRGIYVSVTQNNQAIPVEITPKNRDAEYAVKIHTKSHPIDLGLVIDKDTEKFVLSATGLEAFSDVAIQTFNDKQVSGSSETRADWAGLFTDNASLDFSPAFLKGEQTYKIALYGQIQNDANVQNPYLIEVYSASGGGSRTESMVNEFQGLACGEYSWCNEAAVQRQNETIVTNYVTAFLLMGEQFSAVMMQQVGIIGTFFDAKHQMETKTALRRLQAEAHKDYHPDEQMCRFGTFVRSIAQSDMGAGAEKRALNAILTKAYTNVINGVTAEGGVVDTASRLRQFREVYCDPTDNDNGLLYMCDWEQDKNPATGKVGAADPGRMNKDIDYTRTVGANLALDVHFMDDALTADEEDVIALARNLYWFSPYFDVDGKIVRERFGDYMDARRIIAMTNIAHNSYSEIVSQKAGAELSDTSGPAFMKSFMSELGVDAQEVDELLGESMSYYGQMEVLTKKIYQSPTFYTNLYTKPANIGRISASVDAISSIQQRDQFEASLREEMLVSMMVEQALTRRRNMTNGFLSVESSSAGHVARP